LFQLHFQDTCEKVRVFVCTNVTVHIYFRISGTTFTKVYWYKLSIKKTDVQYCQYGAQ